MPRFHCLGGGVFELVLTFCLASQPTQCWNDAPIYLDVDSSEECAVRGELTAVDIHERHPDWILRKWVCDLPKA
jgi:hypothetical protein